MSAVAREPTALSLVATLVALLLLAGLSLVLSRVDLGDLGYAVALGIALIKAVLVAVFFMEILREPAAIHLAFAACLTLLGLLLVLVVADVITRTVPPLGPPPGNEQRTQG